MLLGPRGTEDFSSWAAWRQGVLAPHLVKTDMGHRRFAWDTFCPTSTWETSLQNHGQSLEDLISFFFFPRMSTALVQILDEQPGLVLVGTTPICCELKGRPGVCS